MEIVSPQVIAWAKQRIYTVCSIMGPTSPECEHARRTYNEYKTRSCYTCKHYSLEKCNRISNYDVVKRKDVPASMQFYFRICGGYFYEPSYHTPRLLKDESVPPHGSL